METRTAELRTKAGNLQRAQEDITKLEQQLKEQRVRIISWMTTGKLSLHVHLVNEVKSAELLSTQLSTILL